MFGDPPLANSVVGQILARHWTMACDRVEYAPIGHGSYHWYAGHDDARPPGDAYAGFGWATQMFPVLGSDLGLQGHVIDPNLSAVLLCDGYEP